MSTDFLNFLLVPLVVLKYEALKRFIFSISKYSYNLDAIAIPALDPLGLPI